LAHWIRLDMVNFLLSCGFPERGGRRALCPGSYESATLLSHYYWWQWSRR